MRLSLKHTICVALIALMGSFIPTNAGSTQEEAEAELNEIITWLSQGLPLNYEDFSVVYIELDGQAKSLVMEYYFTNPNVTAEFIASNDEKIRKSIVDSMAADKGEMSTLLYLIKTAGYRLVIKAYDSDIKVRSIVIPNYDIPVTDITHAPGFNEEEYSDLEMLHLFADTMNEECPYDTDGLKLDEVTVNDKEKWFVFYYVLDTSKTFEIIRDNKEDMKNAFIESFKNDPDMDQLFSLCRNTGYSICLRFLDPFRNATRIVISPSEL